MADLLTVSERVRSLLISLNIDVNDPNFVDTPTRVAQWLCDFTLSKEEVERQCKQHAKAMFVIDDDDMIAMEPFIVYSMCPHHLLPITYEVSLAYIPNKKVIGLSKLVRISRVVARQLIIQESLAPTLADMFCKLLDSDHVAVRVRGIHGCMKFRGVMCEAPAVKSALRGAFREDAGIKQEFYDIVNGGKKK